MRRRIAPLPFLALIGLAACTPESAAVSFEQHLDVMRLEVGPPEATDGGCPTVVPLCLENRSRLSKEIKRISLVGEPPWALETELPQWVAPSDRACVRVVAPATASPVSSVAEVWVGPDAKPLSVTLHVPGCFEEGGATLSFEPIPEPAGACSDIRTDTCVESVGGAAVQVTDVTLAGDPAWTFVQAPPLPVWVTPGRPACWKTRLGPHGAGRYAATLSVEVAGQAQPLTREFAVTDEFSREQLDFFQWFGSTPVDVALVVDDDPLLDAMDLDAKLRGMVADWREDLVDFRVAVTTTDPAYAGVPLVGPSGGPPVLAARVPNAADLLVERATLVRAYDTPDRGLEVAPLLAAALAPRPKAYLSVFFISAGDDTSPGTVTAHREILANLGQPFAAPVARDIGVQVGGAFGLSPDGCTVSSWCTGGDCTAGPAERYGALLDPVEWWYAASICGRTWMGPIRRPWDPLTPRLHLSRTAVPDTLSVRRLATEPVYRWVPLEDWRYASGAVELEDPIAIENGAVLEVRYQAACTPGVPDDF